jgi:serine/threonine protein kinase
MHIPQEFNGEIFHKLICLNETLDIHTFLQIALNLSQVIGEFHRNDIIYKYINPYNILIDMKTKEVKLIEPKDIVLNMSENLHYMSPNKQVEWLEK